MLAAPVAFAVVFIDMFIKELEEKRLLLLFRFVIDWFALISLP